MAMGKVTKSFKVTLDIARSISNREFSVVEGDTCVRTARNKTAA